MENAVEEENTGENRATMISYAFNPNQELPTAIIIRGERCRSEFLLQEEIRSIT